MPDRIVRNSTYYLNQFIKKIHPQTLWSEDGLLTNLGVKLYYDQLSLQQPG